MARAPEPPGPAPPAARPGGLAQPAGATLTGCDLSDYAEMPHLVVLSKLRSSLRGLVEDDAQARLARCGDNAVTSGRPPSWRAWLRRALRDPFAVMLSCLAAVSAGIGDLRTAAVIGFLVVVSCLLRVQQERRSCRPAAAGWPDSRWLAGFPLRRRDLAKLD